MKNTIRFSAICVSSLFLLTSAAAFAEDVPSAPPKAPVDHSQPHGMQGDKSMHEMKMTGDQDYDFAMMMRAHHQKALVMAKEELRKGNAAPLKQMAQSIVDSQSREIAQLDAWLAQNKPKNKGSSY